MASPRNPSRVQQRQVDLTTAVCQERLLTTHVRHVLALVDLVSDRLPFDDALDIYVRVLRLTAEQARNVGSRALAALGRREGLPVTEEEFGDEDYLPEPGDADDEAGGEGSRSAAVFARLRRRIRGRVEDDLRHRINLAAARAEDAIFDAHVDNALTFGKALAEEAGLPESVELYLETMTIPEGYADVIYHRALRTVADEILPPVAKATGSRRLEARDAGTAAAG